jgi:hypothetical protein
MHNLEEGRRRAEGEYMDLELSWERGKLRKRKGLSVCNSAELDVGTKGNALLPFLCCVEVLVYSFPPGRAG